MCMFKTHEIQTNNIAAWVMGKHSACPQSMSAGHDEDEFKHCTDTC